MSIQFDHIVNNISQGVLVIDLTHTIRYANPFVCDCHQGESLVGQLLFDTFPELPRRWMEKRIESVVMLQNTSFTSWHQRPQLFNFPGSRPITGATDVMYQSCSFFAVKDQAGQPLVCITIEDSSATAVVQGRLRQTLVKLEKERKYQNDLNKKLETAQHQLLQSAKLASIGQLAAGIAHEINNPLAFIKPNLVALQDAASRLEGLFSGYSQLIEQSGNTKIVNAMTVLNQRLDADELRGDVRDTVDEVLEGITRIESIVGSLKDFSKLNQNDHQKADLNAGIRSTLSILRAELEKSFVKVQCDLAELPLLSCYPVQLNQVFMNLITNACQAVTPDKGILAIRSTFDAAKKEIHITIADNGCGIPKEQQNRIYDPFFTTRDVGSGAGLGLSVAYGNIVSHNGAIHLKSAPGEGAAFTICLPAAGVG